MCAKFQVDWYTHLCFMAKNQNVQNEDKKREKELNEILLAHNNGLASLICFRFGM